MKPIDIECRTIVRSYIISMEKTDSNSSDVASNAFSNIMMVSMNIKPFVNLGKYKKELLEKT